MCFIMGIRNFTFTGRRSNKIVVVVVVIINVLNFSITYDSLSFAHNTTRRLFDFNGNFSKFLRFFFVPKWNLINIFSLFDRKLCKTRKYVYLQNCKPVNFIRSQFFLVATFSFSCVNNIFRKEMFGRQLIRIHHCKRRVFSNGMAFH